MVLGLAKVVFSIEAKMGHNVGGVSDVEHATELVTLL